MKVGEMTGNVRWSKQFLEAQYDDLFFIADYLIKLYEPCRLKLIPKYRQRAWQGMKLEKGCRRHKFKDTCCSCCEHLSGNGCTVQCISCKTYLCFPLRQMYPKLKESLDIIEDVARKFLFDGYYRNKSEVFERRRGRW